MRRFRCRWRGCDARFTDSSNCRSHELTHLDARPFVCFVPHCGIAFARCQALKSHVRSAHRLRLDDPAAKAFFSVRNRAAAFLDDLEAALRDQQRQGEASVAAALPGGPQLGAPLPPPLQGSQRGGSGGSEMEAEMKEEGEGEEDEDDEEELEEDAASEEAATDAEAAAPAPTAAAATAAPWKQKQQPVAPAHGPARSASPPPVRLPQAAAQP